MSDDLKRFRGAKKSLLQSFAEFRCLMSDEIIYVGDFVDTEYGDLDSNVAGFVKSIKKDMGYIGTLGATTYINGEALLDAYKLTLITSLDAQEEMVRSDYVKAHWEEWFKWLEQGVSTASKRSL